jgi:hypothetical protein
MNARGRVTFAFPAVTLALGVAAYAGPSSRDERLREEAVLEAALRQQIAEQLEPADRARGMVICLGIDPGGAPQSPSREFMDRFKGDRAVRRLAECDRRPTGAVEAMTLRPAVLVTAGPIDWVAGDEAWVTVAYYRTRSRSALRRYRVVREREGWVSLGPILLDGPA